MKLGHLDESLIDSIPSTCDVRAALAICLRRTDLLRKLLSIANARDKERTFREGAAHGLAADTDG